MKITKFKFNFIICICLLVSILTIKPVYAAGLSVSASKSTAYVGDSITFTVKVSGAAGKINVSGAVTDSVFLDNTSKSYTVKATSPGSISVSASGVIADYDTAQDKTVSSSKTVTIKEKSSSSNGSNSSGNQTSSSNNNQNDTPDDSKKEEKKSNINSLSSLSVSSGTLTPKFNSSKTEYSVNLSADQTTINVSAKATDSKAKVSGTGEHSLKPGKNTIAVTCTAEDGSKKKYTITVNVDEKPVTYTDFDGKSLGVVSNLEGIEGPDKSFEKTKVTLNDKEVDAWKSEKLNKTVVYLVNENNEKGYYVYENGKIVSHFQPVSFAGMNMYIVDVPQKEISGMKFQDLTIEEQKIPGWIFNDTSLSSYELFYAMQENGEMAYYLHEKQTNTFMPYPETFLEYPKQLENVKQEIQSTKLFRNVFIGTTALFVVTTVAFAYLYLNFKKKSIAAVKEYIERRHDDEE